MSLPLLHAGRTNPGLSAALDLRFALDKSLTAYRGPTPSFSRASSGTYFGSDGILRTMGLNLLLYSEDFTNGTYWSGGSTTRSGNTAVAPDGSLTADTITFNSGSQIYQNPQISSSIGTISVYVKKVDHRYFSAQIETSSTAHRAVFDLDTALVTETTSGTSASISDAGNGWFRCSVTKTVAGTTAIWATFQQSATATFSTGSGSKQFYMWGAQSEIGSSLNTYSKTTSASNSGPRFDHTYNGTSWISRGLLVEEQRTNSLQRSDDFSNAYWLKTGFSAVSSNVTTSPDGLTTADKLVEDSISSEKVIYKDGFTLTGPIVVSCFMKAAGRNYGVIQPFSGTNGNKRYSVVFDLTNGSVTATRSINSPTGTSYGSSYAGDGWWRCWVQMPDNWTIGTAHFSLSDVASPSTWSAGGFPVYTGNGTSGIYLWGAQVEATSAFPTSYIPTTSASVTRSADVCQITGGDFSGFWNGTEGTLACEFDRLSSVTSSFSSGFPHAVSLVDSGNLVRQGFYGGHSGASPTGEIFLYNGSGRITAGALVSGTSPIKISGAYKASDFAGSLNGATAVTSSSGSIDPVVQMNIGAWASSQYMLNGHIARLRYFNKRLPNADLRYLTGGSRGFQPDNINGLQLWLDASDSSTLFQSSGGSAASADGDPVGYWADKSGNGRNAIQSSGTNKPSVRLNVLNTKPVIRFDGVNDFLGNSMQFANSAFTIIAITKRAGGTNYPSFVCEYSGTTNAYFAFGLDPSSYLSIHKTGLATSASNLVQTAGTFFIQSAQSSGISSGNISVDVKSNGVDASSSLTLTGLLTNSATMFGASKNGTADYFNGDFAEIIIYNSVISGSDLDLVNNYLNQKWSVY